MPKQCRWWLAVVLADWAHNLTKAETGPEPAWLIELGCAAVRAARTPSTPAAGAYIDPSAECSERRRCDQRWLAAWGRTVIS
jgi:hypothetical protein